MHLGPLMTIFPQALGLHVCTLCTPSPNSAVREPPSITVVKAIFKGSLQVPWGCDGGGAETAGLLGLCERQCIAILSCPVVEHNTCGGTSRIGADLGQDLQEQTSLLQNAPSPGLKTIDLLPYVALYHARLICLHF